MEIDLLPSGMKKFMKTIRRVGTYAGMGAVVFLVLMVALGFVRDRTTGIVFSSMVFLLCAVMMAPGFLFDKISQSVVRLGGDQICVLDKRGVCWRSISCSEITAIEVKEISGFFYGHNRDQVRFKYICVFLNGSTNIPDVSYSKLFTHKDLIIIGFHPEALGWIKQKIN